MSFFRTKKTATVPLSSDPSIRRSHLSPDELLSRPAGMEGVTTVGDILEYAVGVGRCVILLPHAHVHGARVPTLGQSELRFCANCLGQDVRWPTSGIDARYRGHCGGEEDGPES